MKQIHSIHFSRIVVFVESNLGYNYCHIIISFALGIIEKANALNGCTWMRIAKLCKIQQMKAISVHLQWHGVEQHNTSAKRDAGDHPVTASANNQPHARGYAYA